MNSPRKCPVEVFTVDLGNQPGYVAHVRLAGSGKKIHETDPFHGRAAARQEGIEWARIDGREVIE
jgi:hypothetical protein